MSNSVFGAIFTAIVSQLVMMKMLVKIRKWDKKYYEKIAFEWSYFVYSTVLIIMAAFTGVNVLVICQLSVLFIMAYMDYKVKEVYRFLLVIYMVISIIICGHNLKNGVCAVNIGAMMCLLAFFKVYAWADGAVMFGIVQSIAFVTKNYIANSIVCFCVIQCIIVIYHVVNSFIMHKKVVSDITVPVLPFTTIVFYIWLVLKMLF